jgi:hypothetical protein
MQICCGLCVENAEREASMVFKTKRLIQLTLNQPLTTLSREQLDHCSSPSDQVDDQHDHSCDQQQVDQTPSHMEAESQKPENQQDGKDCPEHIRPSLFRTPRSNKMGPLCLVLLDK